MGSEAITPVVDLARSWSGCLLIESHDANGSSYRRGVVIRMSVSNESPISAVELLRQGRPFWLPPYGHGNGLDALFWVCIAEIPKAVIPVALEALRVQDIPGWA